MSRSKNKKTRAKHTRRVRMKHQRETARASRKAAQQQAHGKGK